jgi:maltose alpha-D-glucosyltransferase/alpha-amylase
MAIAGLTLARPAGVQAQEQAPPETGRMNAQQKDTLSRQFDLSTGDRWYKNCFIYNLDVHTFQDSDGDGIGDFRGLTGRLPYLKGLGVDVIWLAPFQPSPHRDDGYDVADFYGIDTACGTVGDFTAFLYRAHSMGLRVIMDMVLAHTSDHHPWFLQAVADTNSPYHNWYFWSGQKPANQNKGVAFPGVQKEVWTWQPRAKEYYYHKFYDFQPHLNLINPSVLAEAERILSYWLGQGIDGFRLDAVPFMIEVPRTDTMPSGNNLSLITVLRQFIQWRKGNALLLGEANVDPKEISEYFGETGGGLHMLFNFYGNQYLFYGLASQDVRLLRKAMIDTRDITSVSQWSWFLRNHDEIDLGRLTDSQRNLVYRQFAPDKNMQLYDRGIRRRLAPMLHNPLLLEMAYSLLFSLPGTPELHYGEELGMGDDLSLQERLAVRTPMPWTHMTNAGFTTSDRPIRQLVKGEYGFARLNVADEELDEHSLLNTVRRLAALRKECPEIGLGRWSIPDSSNPHLLVIRYDFEGRALLIVHNFSSEPQQFSIPADVKSLHDLINGLETSPVKPVALPGYGYRWFRIMSRPGRP